MKETNYKKLKPMTRNGWEKLQCCKICGYSWVARKEKPRQCPNCKRQIKYPKVLSAKLEQQ